MNRRELKQNAKVMFKEHYSSAVLVLLLYIVIFSVVGSATSGIAAIFLAPLMLGVIYAYTNFTKNKPAEVGILFEPFRNGDLYLKSVLFMFLTQLFVFLWALLFIIPGIIKSFSYALTPYILADPDFDYETQNPITKSREMMYGHKWELFVLYLSFIGWFILCVLTLGLLYILYVGPYLHQARVLFYQKVKANRF